MSAPFHIVLNAGSGRQDADDARGIVERALARAGRRAVFHLREGDTPMSAVARAAVDAARRDDGIVVAAGGDGTISAVAHAALGFRGPFGVLAQGTFNLFARTHGLPLDTEGAAEVLLAGRTKPVHVGLVNDRAFVVNASLGLYPELLEDREAYKRRFGRRRIVALFAALATLMREHRQLRLHLAGPHATRGVRTPTLFVGNNRLQLEQIGIPNAASVERNCLVAIVPRPIGTLALFALMLRGALRRLGDADDISSFAFDHMRVTPALPYGTRRVKVALDGEIVWMRSPLEFRVAPEPLMLLVPPPPPSDDDTARAATEPAA